MSRALLHRLRHPRHRIVRWGLAMSSFVCLDDDKEWLVAPFWRKVLAR